MLFRSIKKKRYYSFEDLLNLVLLFVFGGIIGFMNEPNVVLFFFINLGFYKSIQKFAEAQERISI